NSTKAGVIGTIAEEQSHVIGGVEKRRNVVPTEKGQESLERATNKYFKDKFGENDEAISLVSDGQDYSNVDFGENVGDKISPEDRAFRAYYRAEVLPYDEDYKNFIVQGVNLGIDMSPLGVSKGMTEGLLGYDAITGEKLDIVTRTMGVIPLFDKTYGFVRAGMKTLKPATRVEAVLSDGTRVLIKSNIDDIAIKNIEKLEKIKKGITSVDTSKAVNKIDIPSNINKIEKITETPKIKAVDDSISTKNLNKDLHEKINTRGKEYYANKQADKLVDTVTAPIDFNGHIINGEINNKGLAVGGHSTVGAKNNVRIDKIISTDKNGVRRAEISIFDSKTGEWIKKTNDKGKIIETTLFPEHWTENRIKIEVDRAYNSKNVIYPIWEGTTPSKIKVRGYIAPKITVYPK
ncbi:EndoU domain-containing protein, partial [Fusobacterium massiliense]|uniref:EndoU domain-containing protein n=1 Tax=Fusobacterium massiliense TaxID=1852365 RepID=UPI0028EE8AE9